MTPLRTRLCARTGKARHAPRRMMHTVSEAGHSSILSRPIIRGWKDSARVCLILRTPKSRRFETCQASGLRRNARAPGNNSPSPRSGPGRKRLWAIWHVSCTSMPEQVHAGQRLLAAAKHVTCAERRTLLVSESTRAVPAHCRRSTSDAAETSR